jgi:hypothetical protein
MDRMFILWGRILILQILNLMTLGKGTSRINVLLTLPIRSMRFITPQLLRLSPEFFHSPCYS